MVGYDKSKEKLTNFDYAFAGGASGFVTRGFCQPFDVLKIRFQLQVEPISEKNVSKYRSIFQASHLILREEGLKAFWKGHVPAQGLSISYGIVQFWSFEVLTKRAEQWIKSHGHQPASKSLMHFTCGFFAGCAATVASFPFDIIRTRLVAQSEQNKIYKGMWQAARDIYFKESPIVLFRGLWPTLLQIGPHAGAQFFCYKLFSDLFRLATPNKDKTILTSVLAGSLAGLCAKFSIYPFDLAKRRMQVQGFQKGREIFGQTFTCKGLNDCLIKIYRIEGLPGFYKGLAPSLIKAVVMTALHFTSYDMICNALLYYKTDH